MIKKLIIPMIIVLSLFGYHQLKTLSYTFDYFYFDTINSVTIYYQNKDHIDTKQIDQGIEDILKTMEQTFSTYENTSTVSTLNSDKTIEMDKDVKYVVEKSLYYCNESGGVYDPTIYPITDLWSISNNNYLPTDQEIQTLMSKVDCNNVVIDGNTLTLTNDASLEFGSVVKGYTADLIVEYLESVGIDQAIINLGGNVSTMDPKRGSSGYTVGITNPLIGESGTVATIEVSNKSVVTSGINQRYFINDQKVYHHIIDANTGYPVANNLASVTIVADNGIDADCLSTMIFLMGLDQGYEYISNLEGVDAIFITDDKKIYTTNESLEINIVDDTFSLETMK